MSPHQLGFGFGKGRRVIKTILAGEDLASALDRQDRFVADHAAPTSSDLDRCFIVFTRVEAVALLNSVRSIGVRAAAIRALAKIQTALQGAA